MSSGRADLFIGALVFHSSYDAFQPALIGVSNFVGSYWWLILALVGLGIYLFTRWKRTPEGAYKWDAIRLRMPLFGELTRMVAISRFTRTLSTLLQSGVPVHQALEHTEEVAASPALSALWRRARAGFIGMWVHE